MKKILSISLALVLLISNVGLTMGTHFCGGHAVKHELMLGPADLNCGMPDMDQEHAPVEGTFFEAPGCCDNEYQTLEIEDDFKVSLEQLQISPDFIIVYFYTSLDSDLAAGRQQRIPTDYSPPLLLRDLPVLNQVFRI